MAVTKEQKRVFQEKIKHYKGALDDLKKETSTIKSVARGKAELEPYVQVRMAILGLQRASTLVLMSRLSIETQGLKNDAYLNDARKEVSNVLNDILKAVGDDLDSGLTENKDNLAKIAMLTPRQRLRLLEGFRRVTNDVKDALGANNKWRWSFPDLHYKIAQLAKSIFDFKEYGASKDPSEEFYRDREEFLHLLIDEMQLAAQEYRSKYELSTKEVSDLQVIQRVFETLIKVCGVTGNQNEVPRIKTSLDAINEKIEAILGDKKKKK